MITNSRTLYLGIFLLIIPLLGFPLSWKFGLVIVVALVLIALSIKVDIKIDLPKTQNTPVVSKEKPIRRPRKKTMTDMSFEQPSHSLETNSAEQVQETQDIPPLE